ncbi:MAG: ThuA domain-containing protein [Candidatus Hydrogenedentes bacterium]|nr:ThuA domain-containing protein [Candidatus Hydrogenedentota bacterium]
MFWGGWEGHEPRACVERFIPFLEKNGFSVQLFDALDTLATLSATSRPALLLPCWTMGQLTQEEEQGFLSAVQAGTGIAGWHGGMCDAFRGNTGYQFMTGGQFVAHPGGIIDYTVSVTAPEDPIVAGIANFTVHSEQYYMHFDPSNEVLATTRFTGIEYPWTGGAVMPVVWKRHFGAGRVFYSALGHCAAEFDVMETRTIMERGLLWAAAGEHATA